MSKMGDWVIELQEDCIYLTREQFAEKHGAQYVYIFDEQLGIVPTEPSIEPRSYENE